LDFSFLYVRLSSNDRFMRMPPMARTVVHEDAVKLLAEWIQKLPLLAEDAKRANPKDEKPESGRPEDDDNEFIGSSESEAKRR